MVATRGGGAAPATACCSGAAAPATACCSGAAAPAATDGSRAAGCCGGAAGCCGGAAGCRTNGASEQSPDATTADQVCRVHEGAARIDELVDFSKSLVH